VDLGHRPHLLPDRPAQPAQRRAKLAVGLRARSARRAADYPGKQQGRALTGQAFVDDKTIFRLTRAAGL